MYVECAESTLLSLTAPDRHSRAATRVLATVTSAALVRQVFADVHMRSRVSYQSRLIQRYTAGDNSPNNGGVNSTSLIGTVNNVPQFAIVACG